jgi:hypothetical protein
MNLTANLHLVTTPLVALVQARGQIVAWHLWMQAPNDQ